MSDNISIGTRKEFERAYDFFYTPDMPAFTTNVEFGYWLSSGKVIYGRPDNASKIKYLDWLYELNYKKKPINDLEILLSSSIEMANKMFEEKIDKRYLIL